MRPLLVAVILFLSASSWADNAYVDAKTGFVFPETISGFKFHKKNLYDDPRLGYGLNYWSDNEILITVIVFDSGLRDISDGTAGYRVRQVMEESRGDVQRAVERGLYRSAQVINDVGAFSPLFLQASYHLVWDNGVHKRSHLFMRGQRRHIVKVRATGPADRQIDASIAKFIDQLSTIIGSAHGLGDVRQ
jgi:hypothetical protein